MSIFYLGQGGLDVPGLRESLGKAVNDNQHQDEFEADLTLPGLSRRAVRVTVRNILQEADHPKRILLSLEGIS